MQIDITISHMKTDLANLERFKNLINPDTEDGRKILKSLMIVASDLEAIIKYILT